MNLIRFILILPLLRPLIWVGLVASTVAWAADTPAPGLKSVEPEHLEEGWNLPAPPLPVEVLEGTSLQRMVRVRRSDGQPTTETWLKAQLTALELDVDGRSVALERRGGDFALTWQVPAAGEVKARLRARTATGMREGPVVAIKIFANVRLKATAGNVDFGVVAGGCGLQEHCKPIDLSGSQQLRSGQRLAISRPVAQPDGGAGWPHLQVHVRSGAGSALIPIQRGTPAVVVEYAPDKALEVCFAAPRCLPVPAKPTEALLVQPIGKGLVEPERAAPIVLLAVVAANPLWQCYLPWIAGLIGLLLAIFVVIGIVKPQAFPPLASLFVGAQESQLARDGGRPLYSVPGGRRGFYRSACCTFDSSGMTVRKASGGTVVLHADGRDIRIEMRTSIEVKERQRWRNLPPEEKILQRGVVHRVGKGFYFRVD
ncbi:MAG: hypothetical protein EXR77_16935 [Myxococcales bacterium]|nr:hypothetical protein [Myxococcales bacterium]